MSLFAKRMVIIFILIINLSHIFAVAGRGSPVVQDKRSAVEPSQSLQLLQEVETPVGNPSHLWAWVTSMSLSNDGSVLALFDMRMTRVSILDSKTLRLLATWGKKGKGPGEFGEYHAWIGMRGDTVYVAQDHRTSLFLRDGTYLDQDIILLNRPADIFKVHMTTGVDKRGTVYFIDGRPKSDYLLGKKVRGGAEEYFLKKDDLRYQSANISKEVVFGILQDGSAILTFSRKPIVERYSSSGSLRWSTNLVEQITYLKKSYDLVAAGKYLLPFSTFWVDEEYTIITFSNKDEKVGEPGTYYVFLNSDDGSIVKVAYAAQSIIRTPVADEETIYEHHLYSPWAIAHHKGILFVFAYNSARLQKYKLTWYR
jgi:hypothetical protein